MIIFEFPATSPLSLPPPGATPPSNSVRFNSIESAKLNKAAGEFEAMLLQTLWKSMKETFSDPEDKSFDPTLENFDDLGMQAFSGAVGNSGALGIKNMILKHLEPLLTGENNLKPASR